MLVIGLGNPDRGDDGAGILVARRLSEGGLQAIDHTGPPLSLLDIWHAGARVIVVDAVISGTLPGTIHVWDPGVTALNGSLFRCSTHEFGLADTIELARTLGKLPGWIRIYGIEAEHFEAGAQMSPQVFAAAIRVVEKIESLALQH